MNGFDYGTVRPAPGAQFFERGAQLASTEGAAKIAMNQDLPLTDLELLRRIAARDSAALGEFYDRHGGMLFALAYRILNDHKDAEDVVQEVLMQLWDKGVNLDPTYSRPLAWVIILTRNRAIDRLRSAQRRARLAEQVEAELLGQGTSPGSVVETVGAEEDAGLVRSALKRLPEDQRRPIMMAFFCGLSQSEIATELNEALGTVKARIRRGMLRLREDLGSRLT